MNAVVAFLRSNRLPVAIGVGALVLGLIASQYLLGLNIGVGLALFAAIGGTTLGAYRVLSRSPVAWNKPLGRVKLAFSATAGLAIVALLIQAVPYGWDRSNPPVTAEPPWDSPRTRELTVRACFDCHSNEVEYPWYSKIAPMSWAVQLHVDQGRNDVNFSEWDRPQKDANESAETVIEGEMPPRYYTLFTHSDARLSEAEKRELIDGLLATFGSDDDGDDERDD